MQTNLSNPSISMKTTLQTQLASIAPSIRIRTHWEHDTDCPDTMRDCPGMEGENPWQAEINATAIIDGEEITTADFLCGVWELDGDDPADTNPDISGYEAGMTATTLFNLYHEVGSDHPLRQEITRALAFIDSIR